MRKVQKYNPVPRKDNMNKFLIAIIGLVVLSGVAFASIGVNLNSVPIGAAADIDCQQTSKGIGCAIVNNDAQIYLASPLVDTALYTATAGVGSSKTLRISADGTIYAF